MNTLKLSLAASTLSLAVIGALLTPAAHAQSQSPAQRIEITGSSPSGSWVRQGDELVFVVPFVSMRTRAEVIAEMLASRAAGEYYFSGDEWVRRDTFVSTKSRAEVTAEAAASRARGDFVRVGDEIVHRHVAQQVGSIASAQPTASQTTAAISVGNAR